MFSTEIYTALNAASITATIDEYTTGVPALFDVAVIPSDCKAEKTLNFYQVGTIDNRLNYGLATYSVSCRAATQVEAETIASAVIAEVNRKSYGDYYLFCQTEQALTPAYETDSYNVPVTITIKKR